MKRTRVRFVWEERISPGEFLTGVSLHSHTMHSRENLGFIPGYTARVPLLAWEMRRQARRYQARTGTAPDYTRGYWTPPLPGPEAYALERRQIEERLGLAALVSLSDHDNIEAPCGLRQLNGTRHVPISVEWTVPLGSSFFHIGVHNLPAADAQCWMGELARYTANPSERLRRELLESLSRHANVLIVLNHPLWDQAGLGAGAHRALLGELVETSGGCIHALELNGLRPWPENQAAIDVARAWNYPLVSGSDRHGCEPNGVVNLTRTSTFSEFVWEVRTGKSEVVFLEHYRQPTKLRILRTICDIMGDHPDLPGRVHWSDRVFCQLLCGTTVPMSKVWNGNAPGVVRYFEHATRLMRKDSIVRLLNSMSEISTNGRWSAAKVSAAAPIAAPAVPVRSSEDGSEDYRQHQSDSNRWSRGIDDRETGVPDGMFRDVEIRKL